ncbi:MAG: magnesium and cobalt transport protein CorA [Actinobacteria bacterium]|nr:MAG: magnesium and cobalt transport protein CorA [Actinomycetota bacterium]
MFRNLVYNKSTKESREVSIDQLKAYLDDENSVVLVDLLNPTDKDYQQLAPVFGFHQLTLDDSKKEFHLPKLDDYPDYLFLIWHALNDNPKTENVENSQVSFYLGKNYLVVIHAEDLKILNEVCDRHAKSCKVIEEGADLLMHTYLDRMTDEYFPLMDRLSAEADILEDKIFEDPRTEYLKDLFAIKHKLLDIRKIVSPQRDMISQLTRFEAKFIKPGNLAFFRDIFDHLLRVIDLADSTRDIVTGAMDIYLSQVSNKLNEIMKKLTIVATIFLPLSFIASVYGMNFRFMPELTHRAGYPGALLFMLLVAVGIIMYTKKKKWW